MCSVHCTLYTLTRSFLSLTLRTCHMGISVIARHLVAFHFHFLFGWIEEKWHTFTFSMHTITLTSTICRRMWIPNKYTSPMPLLPHSTIINAKTLLSYVNYKINADVWHTSVYAASTSSGISINVSATPFNHIHLYWLRTFWHTSHLHNIHYMNMNIVYCIGLGRYFSWTVNVC